MLECVDHLLRKLVRLSIEAALKPNADATTLASAVVLLTGSLDVLRVDALVACKLPPPPNMGRPAVHCGYSGCCSACRGNVVEQRPGGCEVMSLVHTKRKQGPHHVAWPVGSPEANLLTKWRAFIYSSGSPVDLPPDGVAPLLMHPELSGKKGRPKLLRPIIADNWSSAWQLSVAIMGRRLTLLSELERALVVGDGDGFSIIPSTQQQLRHSKCTLHESRLASPSSEPPSKLEQQRLTNERERLAAAMDTSLHEWLATYSLGYSFWVNDPDWVTADAELKRLIVQCVEDDARAVMEEVMEEASGKRRKVA